MSVLLLHHSLECINPLWRCESSIDLCTEACFVTANGRTCFSFLNSQQIHASFQFVNCSFTIHHSGVRTHTKKSTRISNVKCVSFCSLFGFGSSFMWHEKFHLSRAYTMTTTGILCGHTAYTWRICVWTLSIIFRPDQNGLASYANVTSFRFLLIRKRQNQML